MGLGSVAGVGCGMIRPVRGRTKWIGLGLVVVVLGVGAAGAWRYQEHVQRQPDWQIHHTAVPDAAEKVDDVLAQFDRDHLYQAGDYLRSASQYDCIIARVAGSGDVTLWRPSHTQLAPGELSCSAGLALSGEFNTSPH
jgi:hypothetical protein